MTAGLQGTTEDHLCPIFSDWSRKTISPVSAADSGSVCYNRNIINIDSASAIAHSTTTTADLGDLVTPRTRTMGFGPRSFSAADPPSWNSLPSDLKKTSLRVAQFSSRPKTRDGFLT